MESILLLAQGDSIWTRLGVCTVASIVGAILIYSGSVSIKTQSAEESGGRRLVNKTMGKSNSYEGSKAVLVGWIRIIIGVCLILFGIIFIFVGPFLAQ